MRSLTIEYQRFGDPTGVIRISDRYIRTVGPTAPAEEIGVGLSQEQLDRGMIALDYDQFRRHPGKVEAVRRTAEMFLQDIVPYLQEFLSTDDLLPDDQDQDGELTQIDIVTSALELSQLPFEVLEQSHPNLVVTRRIRRPWPTPPVARADVPNVLFVWAEPKKSARSRSRMEVPHERHGKHIDQLMRSVGARSFVEIENASTQKITAALSKADAAGNPFTHVHLLAHGIGPERRDPEVGERILLEVGEPVPPIYLALESEEGTIARCAPNELAKVFAPYDRPETFMIATCHSGEVDSVRSGGTLAHVMHGQGIPVVLASQFALTKSGSDEFLRTFLARVIEGEDPRTALHECRVALRDAEDETYYDRVALVGYIHLEEDQEDRLTQRRFTVALSRLEAASNDAAARVQNAVAEFRVAKELSQEQRAETDSIRQRFLDVREQLSMRASAGGLTNAQLEELYGLQGSSLKRDAEAAWSLSNVLSGAAATEWLDQSHDTLREAAEAYRHAAQISRDHHWTWVQELSLRLITEGSLEGSEDDWVVAKEAACDDANRIAPMNADSEERQQIAEQAIWGLGSLCELHLLGPLVGREESNAAALSRLDDLVSRVRDLGDDFPIQSTLAQLGRYVTWWGQDSHWQLPADVVTRARSLHETLSESSRRG